MTTSREDPSGEIQPLPAAREDAEAPTKAVFAAKLLSGMTALSAAITLTCSIAHNGETTTAVIITMSLGLAAVLTAITAGTLWRDYRNSARMAGLYTAVNQDRRQQYEQDCAAVAEYLQAAVEQMRQVVQDEVGEALAKVDWQVYARGWRDRELAESQQKRSRINGNVAYLPSDRT